jgi:hypothetical protein
MHGALFVTHRDVADIGFDQGVINIKDGPAGVTEDGVHTFFFQYLHDDLSAVEFNG